jgi:cyclopropane-fatty-acyl-phospholipid synthase
MIGHRNSALPLPSRGALATVPLSFLEDTARRSVFALLAGIRHGSITIVERGERHVVAAAGDAPSVTITVKDPRAYRAVLLGGSVGAAEAYIEGLWECDDLAGTMRVLARNIDTLDAMESGPIRLARRAGQHLSLLARKNTRRGSKRNIAQHYDLSNEFFRLFLDESMTYSSAVFERGDETLGEAQLAKLERVCRTLELGPADHLLEIGTGWGALAIHAAKVHGCRVTTTTISAAQHRLATERVRAAGLSGKVTVLLRDYRDLDGRYDKLVSIEMIEAVGHEYLGDYFRACSDRLAPHGAMLLQAITIADQHHDKHRTSSDFIKDHIFPGSCLPSITSMVTAATRRTDLRLFALSDLTPSYARTLRMWRERFLANVDLVRREGFDERFVRMWEYYLAYCEGGFEERYLGCVHALFTKPGARMASAGSRSP